jgi:hypothetical protein
MEPLLRLLRLEAGALDRWRGAEAAVDIERTLAPARLARLDGCVPDAGADGLRRAMLAAAGLGADACDSIASERGWHRPEKLAARIVALLQGRGGHMHHTR